MVILLIIGVVIIVLTSPLTTDYGCCPVHGPCGTCPGAPDCQGCSGNMRKCKRDGGDAGPTYRHEDGSICRA